MHLVVARLLSVYPSSLPASKVDILVCYLFSIDISEQQMREL